MSTVWRYTTMILAGSAVLLAAGLYTACAGLAGSRGPSGLLETRKILRELGGEPGLAARRASLAAMAARLRQERTAHASDGGAFSRRIEESAVAQVESIRLEMETLTDQVDQILTQDHE